MTDKDTTLVATGEAQEHKKYSSYGVAVDSSQGDKAKELKICTFQRPHMRAFHYSWSSFFTAFFIWFSIAPLLPEVKKSLTLTNQDIWTTNIVAVVFDIIMRFIFGAVCDKYGARIPMGTVLMLASIPTACTGLVNNLFQLCLVRLFIGMAGSSFVMCQTWSSRMFAKELVGVANGIVGGWGNVGGGATQIVMGTLLFPLFKRLHNGNADAAWRTVCLVPAAFAFCWGIIVIKTSDDSPLGNYSKMKKTGMMQDISAAASFRQGATNFNSWLLWFQYACCFGVELTMNNAAASYFVDRFGLSIPNASAIASIFGFMNIFARGLGGFCSDKLMGKMGMRGRIMVQAVLLFLEGTCILIFAQMSSIVGAIVMLTIFSIFVQGAEGSTYGIVPYVDPGAVGAVSGLVGAGGPCGAVGFGFGFRTFTENNGRTAYLIMGCVVILSSLSCVLINIKGYATLLCGSDDETHATLAINTDKKDEDKEDDEA